MLQTLKDKIEKSGTGNIKPVEADLTKPGFSFQNRFDTIYTSMTLHHIENTEEILHRFSSSMNLGGYLFIADLLQEDGTFHGNGFKGHRGFDPEILKKIARNAGFYSIETKTVYKIPKTLENGTKKEFPVFFMSGRK